jgi:hypothetical protein
MEPIFEEAKNNPIMLSQLLHLIKDLKCLDTDTLNQVESMNPEEKMEIILAFNEVVKSLMSLLD